MIKDDIKVFLVIVHWNTPSELKILISTLRPSNDVEVIVIDNNSEQSKDLLYCFELIGQRNIKLIRNTKNLGFAKACNQGAMLAKGEWLLFLNPDTHITSQNILKFIRKAEELSYDAASLKASSNNYAKPLPSALSLLIEFSPLRRLVPLGVFKKKTLFGGGLLIKKSVLEKLKGWDEDFFLWFEDSDLTRRLLDNGYKIGWIDVPHNHAGGSSFKRLSEDKRKKIFFSSMNLYARKHFTLFGQLIVKFITLLNKS